MIRTLALIAAVLVPLAGSGQTPAGAPADTAGETDVRAAHARWFAGILGDRAVLEQVLAPDVTLRFPGGNNMPREGFVGLLRSGELSYLSADHRDTTVRVYGDAAVVTGATTLGYRLGSKTDSERLAYTAVYVRRQGIWVLVAWQSTNDRQ